jgi:hypothetical protein
MKQSTAWRWCSKYILLRDAIKYAEKHGMNVPDTVECCSCGRIMPLNSRDSQAGHFISRGMGGASGVYWDERNIHAQCSQCNRFEQGNQSGYREFMIEEYGEHIEDELKILHKTRSYKGRIPAIGEMYKQLYKELEQKCQDLEITAFEKAQNIQKGEQNVG